MYVCVYCTVIPFLLLILLSHSSCALSYFFFGTQFITQREREKEKKSKKKREKIKARDEHDVEQLCLH